MKFVRFSVVAAVLVCTSAAAAPGDAGSDTSARARTSAGDEKLFGQAQRAERSYRHRLARLRRLRHLAQEHDDAQRLAARRGSSGFAVI
jgi:hypothetical protein